MKREIVQNFLNLPGIAGLALMGKRSRPYFYGVDRALNFQQKEVLTQGVQQIIDTTPANFETFEFQFSSHQVYLYKLDAGTSLLVVTTNCLTDIYAPIVQQLKQELQQDMSTTLTTFRLLAGNHTLSGENYWKPSNARTSHSAATSAEQIDAEPRSSQTTTSEAVGPQIRWQEMIGAMNALSLFTAQYLGTVVVANYWKTTQPELEWLQGAITIERSAQLVYRPNSDLTGSSLLTPVQQETLQTWVAAFIDRCTKVIRDFPKTVRQRVLDTQQKQLLFRE
ncbi:hypothetical protein [Thermocoleostomius sinensis]|uniref:Uncharacterized protein n=1 Tax=Thermocoleostomius sinensis A174 TaxID=2016057 RepID=A0A9E8Z8V3_9CYAN|nr:hypothetical protein [Thermocoleostomius sinensis]WAL58645.1 hypothetical protein OXH18_15840 [Thermocoleostomius sinensis A174]